MKLETKQGLGRKLTAAAEAQQPHDHDDKSVSGRLTLTPPVLTRNLQTAK
jgi:hypothetical protein